MVKSRQMISLQKLTLQKLSLQKLTLALPPRLMTNLSQPNLQRLLLMSPLKILLRQLQAQIMKQVAAKYPLLKIILNPRLKLKRRPNLLLPLLLMKSKSQSLVPKL